MKYLQNSPDWRGEKGRGLVRQQKRDFGKVFCRNGYESLSETRDLPRACLLGGKVQAAWMGSFCHSHLQLPSWPGEES